jgi:hypothetical protein
MANDGPISPPFTRARPATSERRTGPVVTRAPASSAERYLRLVLAVLADEPALQRTGERLQADGVPPDHLAIATSHDAHHAHHAEARSEVSAPVATGGNVPAEKPAEGSSLDARALARALLAGMVVRGDAAFDNAADTCLGWIPPEQWASIAADLAVGGALLMLRCDTSDEQCRGSLALLAASPSAVRTLEFGLPA